jgi:alanyl-tRNA synthetase
MLARERWWHQRCAVPGVGWMDRIVTESLELSDPYLRRHEARILAHRFVGDLHGVVLDRSAFYPGGGGQPADRGSISGIPVVEVREVQGERLHLLAELPSTLDVECELDWAHRFDHMQQHHGSHLLARAFALVAQAGTDSFRIASDRSVFDVDADVDRVLPAMAEVEAVANDAVFRNLEVEIRQDGDRRVASSERLRIVIAKGYDVTPCGGTHPRRTAEVGGIGVVSAKRWGQRTRVEFVCGGRLLGSFARQRTLLDATAKALRCVAAEAPAKAAQALEAARAAEEKAARLREALVELEAERIVAAEPAGPAVSAGECSAPTPEHLQALARAVAARGRVALLGAVLPDGKAHLCFVRPRDGAESMRGALAAAVAVLGGRGGGSDEFAHGAGADPARLGDALAAALAAVGPVGPAAPPASAGVAEDRRRMGRWRPA